MHATHSAAGTVAPFVHAGPNGAARFGVPTIMTPALLCDNASELLRMASAALVSLYVFLNYVQRQEDLPPDEVRCCFLVTAPVTCGWLGQQWGHGGCMRAPPCGGAMLPASRSCVRHLLHAHAGGVHRT